MAINRINETDLQNKLVSQLSNRPTDPRSAGGDNMTAQQVKARHDALGLLVKDKLNELLDALNNATVNGEPVTPLSDLITVVADGVSKSLTEWIEAKLTKNTSAGDGVHAYGVDDDGEQEMLPVSASATAGAIPKYGTGGVLPVADGTADGHAMNKGQVDAIVETLTAAIAAKYTKPDGGIPRTDLAASVSAVIGNALLWSNADASATPFKVPIRDGTGVVHGATYGASAISTALVNKEQFEPVKALAEGANKAFSVASYSALATALNAAASTAYKVGQSIYVATEDVPDVWVYSVEDSSVSYTYTTDSAFEAALVAGTLQIGYYTLRPLETEKVDFTGYATETYVGNAISGNIDATLSTTGKSADAKAVGDAIDALIDALVDGVMAVAEATYAESATYAQQADLANQINTDREIEDADTACPPTVFGTVGGNAEVTSGLMRFTELRGHTIKSNQSLLSSKSSSVDFIKRNQCPALDTFFNVLPNTEYEVSGITAGGYLQEFDADKNLINTSSEITNTTDITLTAQTVYAKIQATTYTNVLCYIKWETPNLPYVPYSIQTITLPNIELRSAGSAYDVLYQQGGGKRRISSVDLGTIDWGYVSATDHEAMYSTGLASLAKHPATDGTLANILCGKFDTVTRNQQYNHVSDGIIALSDDGTLYVYSSTMGTDASAFKTAMSGVMLYYEDVTETAITIEENPGWDEFVDIDNFGTVKFNQSPAQDIPVPQAYFVRYTVSLVEFLDTLFVHCSGDANKVAIVVPDAPTTDGSYTLKVTVSSGTPTYTWVADE